MLVSGVMDMIGVLSLVPFLMAIADIENIQNVWYLERLYELFGISDIKMFLISLAILSFLALILNHVVRVGSTWVTYHVSMRIYHNLNTRLFKYYLEQPYLFFLNRNSSEMIDKLFTRMNSLVAGLITPAMLIISHAFTGVVVIILLLNEDVYLTSAMITLVLIFYLTIYHFIQHKIASYGEVFADTSPKMIKLATESFGGIKELKVLGRLEAFINQFTNHSYRYTNTSLKYQVCLLLPGGLIEVMAVGSILMVGSYLLYVESELSRVLPILGMYLIASRRLQPALANISLQVGQLRYYRPSIDVVWPDVEAALANETTESDQQSKSLRTVGGECQKIEVVDLTFSYSDTSGTIIDGLKLEIPALHTVGIVGESGAGKTTLVDLMLGLLDPDKGHIRINDISLREYNRQGLYNHIGYVPQNVFLADDTIIRNIAFGCADEDIDIEKVHGAAKLAQIHSFIETELPGKYETLIGERGVRISGGQRQRLGIARALYHDPEILVLDEATSALDGITEMEFTQAVRRLARQKTIIIIAHRLTTLKDCDEIFFLRNGKLVDQGSFESLLKSNPQFAEMANVKS